MEPAAQGPNPSLDRDVLFALDACRPPNQERASDDAAALPEDVRRLLRDDRRYSAWLEQSAAFDSAVAAAYADVPLPEGLAERLQSALAADGAALSADAATRVSAAVAESSALLGAPASSEVTTFNRRRWLSAAGATLAATAAGWGFLAWWRSREQDVLTAEEVQHEILALHQRTAELRNQALPVSKQNPPAAFPFSEHVRPEAEPRWRALPEPVLGRNGLAYELTAPGAPRAVLYVLAIDGERGAPGLPPLSTDAAQAPQSTGGCSLGMWREGDRLFVLVVDGDERRYRGFVELPAVIA